MGKNKIITLWGILDIAYFAWYLIWRLIHGQIPFYFDISKSIASNTPLGISALSLTIFSLILYISLIFSGIYLIKHNKIGALLSYIQTPFRLLTLIPPSIFFITWPLKYIFGNPQAVSAIITFVVLLLVSEILKLYSVITWQRNK